MLISPRDLQSAILRDPLIVTSHATVKDAIALMRPTSIFCSTDKTPKAPHSPKSDALCSSCVVVLDDDTVVGLLTERDLVDLMAQQLFAATDCTIASLSITQVMSQPIITLYESELTDISVVLILFQRHQIHHLPILDGQDQLVGLITSASLWNNCTITDMSDRQRAEHALAMLNVELEHRVIQRTRRIQEQKSQLQDLLVAIEAAVDGISILHKGVYIYVNQSHLDLFGYEHADELLGKPWSILYSPAEIITFEQVVFPLLDHEQAWQGEVIATRKDGSTFAEEVSLTLTQTQLLVCVCRDITERKHLESERQRAEQLIREQAAREKLLREITQRIRQSLDLATIFDTACHEIRQVLQADRVGIFKFEPNSGLGEGEFVAESVLEPYGSVTQIRIHGHCFSEKYASLWAKGQFLAAEDIYSDGLQPYHTDTLAKFQVRANLVMPLLCNHKLWGLLCIHSCAELRAWKPTEISLTQQLANQLAIAIQQANLYEQLQQELTERQQADAQLTERNEQLAISNEELARATRLKDEFLANMSHELRTPLNAILGMTEGLKEQIFGHLGDRQLKALHTIERSSSHLLELINDILDVAKIESGQMELDLSHVEINSLCLSSLAFVKQLALKKHIQIETHLPSYLPQILVDERRMRQVLINLLNNAVKFTPEQGHITLSVDTASAAEILSHDDDVRPLGDDVSSFLQIAVSDTGIGIAPDHLDTLFQPFVQIDSALNRQYAGTGLGLVMVKRIVQLHGGMVNVTSTLGRGSCFTVSLPCKGCSLSAHDTDQNTRTECVVPLISSAIVPPTQAPLILLAEDNEANINTISSYLKAKGYQLIAARNGKEAIDLAQSEQPDLVLMDIQMPGGDGFEAMEHIRNTPICMDVPIIALTALAMVGDRERCIAAGANDYLSKPIRLKQLVTMIEQILSAQ